MSNQMAQKRQVGQNIKDARNAAKLTLDGLAAKCFTSRQHLIRLEQGLHMPGEVMLAKIADACGTTADLLLPDDEEEAAAAMADPKDFAAAMIELFDRRYGARDEHRTTA